ncbi:MAG: hypothetical protein LE178_00595 [Endomicrobium sp.]|nr:hypothetical protein [Endomicrobium sp.]
MIMDNLDSSIGKSIAENIHTKYAVISNATLKNSYVDTLKDNVAKLKKALWLPVDYRSLTENLYSISPEAITFNSLRTILSKYRGSFSR